MLRRSRVNAFAGHSLRLNAVTCPGVASRGLRLLVPVLALIVAGYEASASIVSSVVILASLIWGVLPILLLLHALHTLCSHIFYFLVFQSRLLQFSFLFTVSIPHLLSLLFLLRLAILICSCSIISRSSLCLLRFCISFSPVAILIVALR